MSESRSMKMADIIARAREDKPPPVERSAMNQQQLAVLHAYWRARSYRSEGQLTLVKDVEAFCTEDIGYDTVPRNKVPGILDELKELGWPINDLQDERKKSIKPVREPREPKPVKEPRPPRHLTDKRVPKPRHVTEKIAVDDLEFPELEKPPELVKGGPGKSAKVRIK